jgi:hypothetical protein
VKIAVLLLLACAANGQMRTVRVDAAKVTGTIRSLQGVGGAPVSFRGAWDVSRQYRDLRIDLVRTHDFFGPTDIDARWTHPDDIAKRIGADGANSIFPDWNADPEREASYNFGPSDRIINAIVNSGAGVYFRIGRSWSADPDPPPDFEKYANLVKHVAMHYNAGWAHGYHHQIRYWEVWNEPNLKYVHNTGQGSYDAQPFWSGTPEQFYKLYETVARTLKAYDATLQVGGPGLAFAGLPNPYREGLIAYCAQHRVPLDFFSWHHYTQSYADPFDLVRISRDIRGLLDAHGFPHAQSIVSEWAMSLLFDAAHQQSIEHAAFLAVAQMYFQDAPLDRSLYYRADPGALGFFDADGTYRKKACAFKAVGAMLDTPQMLSATGADTQGFAVLAGRSTDGKSVQVLIANYEIPEIERKRPVPAFLKYRGGFDHRQEIEYRDNRGYALTVKNLPWGDAGFTVKRYRLTATENLAKSETTGHGPTLEISNPLPPPGVELIVIGGN